MAPKPMQWDSRCYSKMAPTPRQWDPRVHWEVGFGRMPMGECPWDAESDDDYDARFHQEGRHAGQSGKWWLESTASAGVPSAASAGNPYGGEGPGVATQFPPKTPKRERCGEPCNCLACGPRCCGGQRSCIIRGPHGASNHRCLPCLTRNPIRREANARQVEEGSFCPMPNASHAYVRFNELGDPPLVAISSCRSSSPDPRKLRFLKYGGDAR